MTEHRFRVTVEGEEIYCRTLEAAEAFLSVLSGDAKPFVEMVAVTPVRASVEVHRGDPAECLRPYGLRRIK